MHDVRVFDTFRAVTDGQTGKLAATETAFINTFHLPCKMIKM